MQWTAVGLDQAHAPTLATICYNLAQTDRCVLAAWHCTLNASTTLRKARVDGQLLVADVAL
jgi:hypothetical protein